MIGFVFKWLVWAGAIFFVAMLVMSISGFYSGIAAGLILTYVTSPLMDDNEPFYKYETKELQRNK